MRSPDMHSRCYAWGVIERCHPEDDMRLRRSLGDKLRSTNRTKAPQLPRRGLVGGEFLLARASAALHWAGPVIEAELIALGHRREYGMLQ